MVYAALNSSQMACTCAGSCNALMYASLTAGGKTDASVPQSDIALSTTACGAAEIRVSGNGSVCDKSDQGQNSIIRLSARSHTSAPGMISSTARRFTYFG